jgi:uncharacterized protein YutE (UPF0331/DUF86 family)
MSLSYDEDIVLGKLASISDALDRIEQVTRADADLEAWIVDDLCTLYLQRAVEACIDLANHLIGENRWSTPKSASQAFEVLCEQGIYGEDFTDTLISMVGFRNVAVHAYGTLDPKVVRSIVDNHLDDLRDFSRRVVDLTVGS